MNRYATAHKFCTIERYAETSAVFVVVCVDGRAVCRERFRRAPAHAQAPARVCAVYRFNRHRTAGEHIAGWVRWHQHNS